MRAKLRITTTALDHLRYISAPPPPPLTKKLGIKSVRSFTQSAVTGIFWFAILSLGQIPDQTFFDCHSTVHLCLSRTDARDHFLAHTIIGTIKSLLIRLTMTFSQRISKTYSPVVILSEISVLFMTLTFL